MMLRFSVATSQRIHRGFPRRYLPDPIAGVGTIITTDSRELSVEAEALAELQEALKPARGLMIGFSLSLAVWTAIGLLVWFVLGR